MREEEILQHLIVHKPDNEVIVFVVPNANVFSGTKKALVSRKHRIFIVDPNTTEDRISAMFSGMHVQRLCVYKAKLSRFAEVLIKQRMYSADKTLLINEQTFW